MIMRRSLLVVLTLCLFAAGGCGAGTSSGPADGASDTGVPTDLGDVADLTGRSEVTIEVVDNSYKPRAAKVSPGTKITFANTGVNPHNVTPNEEGAFVALPLVPGQSGVVAAPADPRTYRFYCTIHGGRTSGQRGAILVVPGV